MQAIRIIEIPDCKMVSSGVGMFGEERFTAFHDWFTALPPTIFPQNFLFWDDSAAPDGAVGLHWLHVCADGMQVPQSLDIIDFAGGLYAVATDVDQRTDMTALDAARDAFLAENGLQVDESRPRLGNIITTPRTAEILGYEQMDYYTPVKAILEEEK